MVLAFFMPHINCGGLKQKNKCTCDIILILYGCHHGTAVYSWTIKFVTQFPITKVQLLQLSIFLTLYLLTFLA